MSTKFTFTPRRGTKVPTNNMLSVGEIVVQYEGNPEEVGLYAKMTEDSISHFPTKEYVQDAVAHSQITGGNPHNVTKTQVGLGSVDNTADVNKPISNNQKTYIANNYAAKTDIINNVTSTNTDKPLSAAQGKVLMDAITTQSGAATADLTNLKNRVSSCENSIADCLSFINTNAEMFI